MMVGTVMNGCLSRLAAVLTHCQAVCIMFGMNESRCKAARPKLTIRKELRFIRLRILFSIWDTLRKTLSSSFSRSRFARSIEEAACR